MHASGHHARLLTGPAGKSPIARCIRPLISSQRVSYLTRLPKPLIRGTVSLYRASTILWCSGVASHSRGVLDAIPNGIYVVRLLELVTSGTCEWGPSISHLHSALFMCRLRDILKFWDDSVFVFEPCERQRSSPEVLCELAKAAIDVYFTECLAERSTSEPITEEEYPASSEASE